MPHRAQLWQNACLGTQACTDTAVHGMAPWPADIWPHGFQRLLCLLAVPHAKQATFKCFRAGHATELAASVASLAEILEAGSWKSNAFARYVDADAADRTQMVRLALALDGDE